MMLGFLKASTSFPTYCAQLLQKSIIVCRWNCQSPFLQWCNTVWDESKRKQFTYMTKTWRKALVLGNFGDCSVLTKAQSPWTWETSSDWKISMKRFDDCIILSSKFVPKDASWATKCTRTFPRRYILDFTRLSRFFLPLVPPLLVGEYHDDQKGLWCSWLLEQTLEMQEGVTADTVWAIRIS